MEVAVARPTRPHNLSPSKARAMSDSTRLARRLCTSVPPPAKQGSSIPVDDNTGGTQLRWNGYNERLKLDSKQQCEWQWTAACSLQLKNTRT